MSEAKVHEVQLLDESECAKAAAGVMQLRNHWIPYEKNESGPYAFTLGLASYRFGADKTMIYRQGIQDSNPRLQSDFGWLYQIVLEKLTHFLKAPIRFSEQAGLPGFHMFKSLPKGGSIHFDLQYLNVSWANQQDLDFNRTVSITIPIQLPEIQVGLNFWPEFDYQKRRMTKPSEIKPLVEIEKGEMHFQKYKIGHAYIFYSHLLHQISAFTGRPDDKFRITLQAHAILSKQGHWIMYW